MGKTTSKVSNKIFVIDTSVILYDHNAIFNFEENDVAIPITVFEELDDFKKGNDTINYEAREFIRIIDKLAIKSTLKDWVPIVKSKGRFKVIMTENPNSAIDATKIFHDTKPDHHILNATLNLIAENPSKKITLVSKDNNLRLKAKSLNINSEDYLTGKIQDTSQLFTGRLTVENIDDNIIDQLYKTGFCEPTDLDLKVHVNLDGDTMFPELDSNWKLVSEEFKEKDDKNEYDHTYQIYNKK